MARAKRAAANEVQQQKMGARPRCVSPAGFGDVWSARWLHVAVFTAQSPLAAALTSDLPKGL